MIKKRTLNEYRQEKTFGYVPPIQEDNTETEEDKPKYSLKEMKLYAEHCMTKLLTNYPDSDGEMGEISAQDLRIIQHILNKRGE